MTSRQYTVAEVEELRAVVETKFLCGSYRTPPGAWCSRTYQEADKVVTVEEQVRTHMAAGHTAADLLASEPPEEKTA